MTKEPTLEEKTMELARTVAGRNPLAWFQAYGAIFTKDGKAKGMPVTGELLAPNYMQKTIGKVIAWFQERNLPVRIISLKPRQEGSTTIVMAAAYHFMSSAPEGTTGRIIGGNEETVRTLFEMCEKYSNHDAYFQDNPSEIMPRGIRGRWANGSELKGCTLGGKSGAIGSMNPLIISTEVALWDSPGDDGIMDAEERYLNIIKTCPYSPGTMMIEESTARGATGLFYNRYMRATPWERVLKEGKIAGDNATISIFTPFYRFDTSREIGPDMSEEAAKEFIANLDPDEVQYRANVLADTGFLLTANHMKWRRFKMENDCGGDPTIYNRDFPYSINEAFTKSGSPRFSKKSTSILRRNALASQTLEYGNLTLQGSNPFSRKDTVTFDRVHSANDANWHIYEHPLAGCRYYVVDDPSLGKIPAGGKDPDNSGIGVFRAGYRDDHGIWRPMKLVACAANSNGKKLYCLWPAETAERELWKASKYYGGTNMVPIVIETPIDDGLNRTLKDRGAPLYVQRKANAIEEVEETTYGFRQTVSTKGDILGQLEQRLMENFRADDGGILDGGGIDIPDLWTIDEIEGMVRKPDGSVAAGRAHDDRAMMTAIACAVEKCAQPHVAPTRRLDKWEMSDRQQAQAPRRGNFW